MEDGDGVGGEEFLGTADRLVARVATLATVESWVVRAKERTLRHLHEEIDVAELLARWSESATVVPPSVDDVGRVQDLERAVVTGQKCAPPPAAPTVAQATAGVAQGNVQLRLWVYASTARDFRHWEATYLRHRGSLLRGTSRGTSFLRFACELFADIWRPRLPEVAYGHVYARDLYRCQSPCCGRRDVTPHHLRFRSRGGDDSDENLTSLVPSRRHSPRPDVCGAPGLGDPLELRAERAHDRRRAAAEKPWLTASGGRLVSCAAQV